MATKISVGLLLSGISLVLVLLYGIPMLLENPGTSQEETTTPRANVNANFVIQLTTSGCYVAYLSYEPDSFSHDGCGNRTFNHQGAEVGVKVRFDAPGYSGMGSGTLSIYKDNGTECWTSSW